MTSNTILRDLLEVPLIRQSPYQLPSIRSGLFKASKIGNETTYDVEFKLPYISKCLDLPIFREALGGRFESRDISKDPIASRGCRVF